MHFCSVTSETNRILQNCWADSDEVMWAISKSQDQKLRFLRVYILCPLAPEGTDLSLTAAQLAAKC